MTLQRRASVAASSGHGRASAIDLEATELGVERRCNACGEMWPLDSEFYYRQPNGFLGYQGICKACKGERRGVGDGHRGRVAA